jgi:hypothetical protein|tara:strand:- start:53 stop:1105 length:1053 start_codon:yes stop_codon:yes gene_type:complete
MKKLILIFITILISCAAPKKCCSQDIDLKKYFKFATFYGAVNGGTSVSDVDVFSVTDGLQTTTVQTPFDYNIAVGIRKIARFGYENRANTFYDGTETSFSDGSTLGKIKGVEFLFEADIRRQEGVDYLDQHHFVRYVDEEWILKAEYLVDGFADVEYFETSQRYKYNLGKLTLNIGAVQRMAEPYGYDPLEEWVLDNGDIHYTYLALQEGYNVNVFEGEYYDPNGNLVATSSDIWQQIIIPQVLSDYTEKKRNELPVQWNHSLVLGFDYYHYTKSFWLHSWGNLMPYHYDDGSMYSYHKFYGDQWYDYSGGLIFGTKINKSLGTFVEGKYNKYWNREWYDFKFGINYIIF